MPQAPLPSLRPCQGPTIFVVSKAAPGAEGGGFHRAPLGGWRPVPQLLEPGSCPPLHHWRAVPAALRPSGSLTWTTTP